jgi:hypothetical protein
VAALACAAQRDALSLEREPGELVGNLPRFHPKLLPSGRTARDVGRQILRRLHERVCLERHELLAHPENGASHEADGDGAPEVDAERVTRLPPSGLRSG